MSGKLLEILKSNSNDIKFLKEQIVEINKKLEVLDNEVKVNTGELKNISNKSYYIEKYLESVQDSEIQELMEKEEELYISTENQE